jgi:hypothetical protein
MQLGYVSSRPGARPHLAINGRAHCGAGSGRITGKTVALTRDLAKAGICLRCIRRVEALTTDALHDAMRRTDFASMRRVQVLNDILDLMESPATRAAVNALAAHTVAANRARVAAERPAHALSGFGALAAAHRAAAARDRQARQLTLV